MFFRSPLLRLKLLYDPDGYTEVMDRFCHIAVNAVHYGLRVAREEGLSDLEQDHAKFYNVQHAVQDLPLEVGNQFAGRGRCCSCAVFQWGSASLFFFFFCVCAVA